MVRNIVIEHLPLERKLFWWNTRTLPSDCQFCAGQRSSQRFLPAWLSWAAQKGPTLGAGSLQIICFCGRSRAIMFCICCICVEKTFNFQHVQLPKKDLKVNQLLHRSPQKHLPTVTPSQHQKPFFMALLGDSFASARCREQWSSKGTPRSGDRNNVNLAQNLEYFTLLSY